MTMNATSRAVECMGAAIRAAEVATTTTTTTTTTAQENLTTAATVGSLDPTHSAEQLELAIN